VPDVRCILRRALALSIRHLYPAQLHEGFAAYRRTRH
jgi:hypothetical protein